MSDVLAERMKKIQGITGDLNAAALKKNPARTTPAVYLAAGNEQLMSYGRLPTGIPNVDVMLGGGFPRGASHSWTGRPGVGKTCALMDMVAHNQATDPAFIALWINLESSSFPVDQALRARIDFERLLIANARGAGEDAFGIALAYLWDKKTREALDVLDMVVIDSITAAVPRSEIEGMVKDGLDKESVGRQAAMLSKMLRILNGTAALGKACFMMVNQVRVDVGGYGGEIMPCGKAVEHYSKMIVKLSAPKAHWLKRGKEPNEEVYGHRVTVEAVKNNSGKGRPHAETHYPVLYDTGVDLAQPLVEACLAKGVILQTSASWYALPQRAADGFLDVELDAKGKVVVGDKANGKEALCQLVRDEADRFSVLKVKLVNAIEGETLAAAPQAVSELTDLLQGEAADDAAALEAELAPAGAE